MKKFLLSLVTMLLAVPVMAKNDGRQLSALLQQVIAQEEIHPDSIFPSLRMLEQKRRETTSPQLKAMYATALGRLYVLRAYRSQSVRQQTQAHPDSIQEWSREDYMRTARERFEEALADKDMLFKMPVKDWIPLVKRGKDDAIFGGNMLYVVWHTMRGSVDGGKPGCDEMIQYYKVRGMREAAFFIEMEHVGEIYGQKRQDELERICREYADLSLAAQAQFELLQEQISRVDWWVVNRPEEKEKRYRQMQDILARYPKYANRGFIENQMLELKSPLLNSIVPRVVYSGSELTVPVTHRNLKAYSLRLYLVPDSISEDSEEVREDPARWLMKNGRLVGEYKREGKAGTSPFEEVKDTVRIPIPDHGAYVLLADGVSGEKLNEKVRPVTSWFFASHFMPIGLWPAEPGQVMVVNRMTGKPEADVEVVVKWHSRHSNNEKELEEHYMTDQRGIALIPNKEVYYAEATLRRGEDCHYNDPLSHVFDYYYGPDPDREGIHYVLNTDRSIYRPGQTIQVSGVVYRQRDWDATVAGGQSVFLKLSFGGERSKVLADTVLVSDEFGCFSTSFALPATAKLGGYEIWGVSHSKYIRVEEYKRPTFEVTIDEPVLDKDVTFSGRAMTYAGVPVRNARVTGEYTWNTGWLKRIGSPVTAPTRIDTLWTDDEGRFTVKVPNTLKKDEMAYGRWLTLNVDVLNNNGETQQGSRSVSISSTPLRISADVSELQDKERLKPWRFDLVDALGKDVQTDVQVSLKQEGRTVFTATTESNKSLRIKGLEQLASGAYTLVAQATEKGDTARMERRIVLFCMDDQQLPVDTTSWFYCPSEYFSATQPARVQVGSSLKDVTVYCVNTTDGKRLATQTVTLPEGGCHTFSIPYTEEMGHGASADLFFVKDGKVYMQSFGFSLEQPDRELKTRWTTFRDRLKPGQQEKWTLHISRPDGSPAQANLLATLYDGSLDAIAPHALSMQVWRNTWVRPLNHNFFMSYPRSNNLFFFLKYKKEYQWMFSELDGQYFEQQIPAMGDRILYAKGVAIPERQISFSTKGISAREFEGLGVTSVDEALQGRIAGLDIVANSEELGTGAMRLRGKAKATGEVVAAEAAMEMAEPDMMADDEVEADVAGMDWSILRTNFNETAFFYPQLRTNAEGEVDIEFTLPESLTRWHLLGVAHTKDMMTGKVDEGIVAQKSLMAQLFLPRFLRVGDQATLTATIQNISEEQTEKGTAVFELLDARTEKVLLRRKLNFGLEAGQDTAFYVNYKVQDLHTDLICRWVANGRESSDGEQRLLPVLSDRETVVTTKALTLLKEGVENVRLDKLFPGDATERHLTVEYTTHPIWNAIEALSDLAKPTCEDVLSLASAYYAASLTQYIRGQVPDSEKVLKVSKVSMDFALEQTFDKLKNIQCTDGSFTWFPGMGKTGSPYLTREVAFLLTRLHALTGGGNEEALQMQEKAIAYLRGQLGRKPGISLSSLRHLYIVSMAGMELNKAEKDLLGQLAKTSDEWTLENRALASIVLCLQDKNRATNRMMDGVEKYLVGTPEKGRYIDYPGGSFTSIDRKLHIHTQIMEAVMMVRPKEKELWNGMLQYLLLQKRTTDWNTPVNTANAVYVLMQGDRSDLADEAADVLRVKGKSGGEVLRPKDQAKGYLKQEVSVANPQTLTITKQSKGQSWGAVYAQFEQQIDSVDAVWQGVNIRREVSNNHPKVGEKVHIRYVITASQDYDYVQLHAPRPASTEPQMKISGYRYSNGLGYYCQVRDAATDYYFEHLPKGTYVLEEDVMVERAGEYNAGITTIQCLYAPEFSARTGNLKITTKK